MTFTSRASRNSCLFDNFNSYTEIYENPTNGLGAGTQSQAQTWTDTHPK